MADPQNSQDFESEDAEPAVISLSDVISPSHTQAVFGADQATHKGDSSTTLNPTFERVLSARNAHVWVPIAVSSGVFLLGSIYGIRGHFSGHRLPRLLPLKFAAGCATFGTLLFWEMGTREYFRRIAEDEDLTALYLPMRIFAHDRFIAGYHMGLSQADSEQDSYFDRVRGPYFSEGAGTGTRILETISYWTHHAWSTRSAQAWTRRVNQLILEIQHVSPHDIDIVVTQMSRGLNMNMWEKVSNSFSLVASCMVIARLATVRSKPLSVWFNCLMALSICGAAVTGSFRRYQYVTYPCTILDKSGTVLASANPSRAKLFMERDLKAEYIKTVKMLIKTSESMIEKLAVLRSHHESHELEGHGVLDAVDTFIQTLKRNIEEMKGRVIAMERKIEILDAEIEAASRTTKEREV